MSRALSFVEPLRKLITPDKPAVELAADLEPGTELDSLIRDFFTRLVRKIELQDEGPIILDLEEINDGFVHWQMVQLEGKSVAQIWWSLNQEEEQ